MKWKSVVALAAALFTPFFVFAQSAPTTGLVPCGDTLANMCQWCHVAQLLNNVMNWLVSILFIIFAIMVVASGIQLVTSGGNTAAKESAKRRIMNVLIGFIIVLAAWLLIDFAMKQLLSTSSNSSGGSYLGPWNSIRCVTQPNAPFTPAGGGIATAQGAPVSCQIGTNASGPIYDCTGVCPAGATAVPNAAGTAATCVVQNSGGGSCTDGTGTACDPANLGCFSNPSAASQVCMLESGGGNTNALSGTDLCQDGNSFSVGLWQINLLVNSQLIPGCSPGIFSSPSCPGGGCQGSCVRRVTNSNGTPYCAMWDCTVTNQGAYNTCVANAQNPANNNQAACQLYASQGASAWAYSVRACGVQP